MLSVLVALMPLLIALVMLTVFGQNSRVVGFVTLGSALFLVSVFPPFRLSPFHVMLSFGMGIAGSLTLLTVLLPAIFLYQVQQAGGAMAVLIDGISRITPDHDLLILLLVFGLAPFLDAICGMNVGIFVIAPILVTLRISPLRVACLCMLSLVTSVWGTMSVGTLIISNATNVSSSAVGSNGAILLIAPTISLCATSLLLAGRNMREMLHAWLPIVGTGLLLMGGGWIATRFLGVELVGMLTSLAVIAFLALLGRVQVAHVSGKSRIFRRGYDRLQLWKASLPYTILTLLLLLSRVINPLQDWLQTHVVLSSPSIGLSLPILYLPGLWLLVMTCLAIFLLRLRGNQIYLAALVAWKQFAPSAIAIISFLVAAHVMQESGMIATFGGVVMTLGTRYVWVSPWLGAISGWATGSTISGNSLFATLQKTVALRTGLPVPWIIATQNTASSLGKILSPTSAILAVSAAGIPGQEGLALRKVGYPVLFALIQLMILLDVIIDYSITVVPLLILMLAAPILFAVFKHRSSRISVASQMGAIPMHTMYIGSKRLAHLNMGQQSKDLLVYLAQTPQGMSRTKLSVALGQPVPVTHRLLRSLLVQGYVQRESANGLYILGRPFKQTISMIPTQVRCYPVINEEAIE